MYAKASRSLLRVPGLDRWRPTSKPYITAALHPSWPLFPDAHNQPELAKSASDRLDECISPLPPSDSLKSQIGAPSENGQ